MSSQKERPIIFSGNIVRAILDNRKSQTRRVIKPQPTSEIFWSQLQNGKYYPFTKEKHAYGNSMMLKSPYGYHKGDKLWVRETWREDAIQYEHRKTQISYKADSQAIINGKPLTFKWKPSIHMPKWASRITLEITDIRVERVQEISALDCRKEGASPEIVIGVKQEFKTLWNSINEKRGYGWDKNPYVWVISFKK